MPIPKDVQDALVSEAMAKETGRPSGTAPRISPALAMLINALQQAQIAANMLMTDQHAAPQPPPSSQATIERMREVVRPKTFNQSPPSKPEAEKDYGPTSTA